MKTREVKFKTVLSSLKKGERPCYRAVVNHNGTVYMDEISSNAANRVGMDPAVMKFNAELFFAQIAEELRAGNRVEVENLFSGGIAVTGTFAGANAPWDKSKNALVPYFFAITSAQAAYTPERSSFFSSQHATAGSKSSPMLS